jgi:hypothetical protein
MLSIPTGANDATGCDPEQVGERRSYEQAITLATLAPNLGTTRDHTMPSIEVLAHRGREGNHARA